MEERVPVKGYEGLYEVTNDGRVFGKDRVVVTRKPAILGGVVRVNGKEIVPDVSGFGYRRVRLCREATQRKVLVHRLVLSHFVGEPESDDMVARHLDGNPANNHHTNLAWGTAVENWQDRKRHGRGMDGVLNPLATLTEEQVRAIRLYAGDAKPSAEMAKRLAEKYSVGRSCIRHIAARRSWRHLQ